MHSCINAVQPHTLFACRALSAGFHQAIPALFPCLGFCDLMLRCPNHTGRAKEALKKRLEVTEERLAHLCGEQPMQGLVEAKLRLAQADFHTLELQVGCAGRLMLSQ